ncbi:MAG TPA: hypothetical protein DDY71_05205 [Spirochaetia bacterium]|nr:hypothetical protein [Spirochaetia bacterium]
MKVELNFDKGYCKVTREPGDKRITQSGYSGQHETTLFYGVKNELRKRGYDLIQKRMWKDGHMVSDHQNYLRTRTWKGNEGEFCIYNPSWQTQDAGVVYNRNGKYFFELL